MNNSSKPKLEDLTNLLEDMQSTMEEIRHTNEEKGGALSDANKQQLDFIGTPDKTYKRMEDMVVSLSEMAEQLQLYISQNPDLENGISGFGSLINSITSLYKEFTHYYKMNHKYQITANLEMVKHENRLALERLKHEHKMAEIAAAKSSDNDVMDESEYEIFDTMTAVDSVDMPTTVNIESAKCNK